MKVQLLVQNLGKSICSINIILHYNKIIYHCVSEMAWFAQLRFRQFFKNISRVERTNQHPPPAPSKKDCIETERKGAQEKVLLSEILYKHLPHRFALKCPWSLGHLNQALTFWAGNSFSGTLGSLQHFWHPWPAHQAPAVDPRNCDNQNAPTLSNAPGGAVPPQIENCQTKTQSKPSRVPLLPSRFCSAPQIRSKGTGASRDGPHLQS